MKPKTYHLVKLTFFLLVFALIAYSYLLGQAFIAFFTIGFYLVIISLLRTRVNGIIADERQITMANKAAQVSFQILLPLLLLTSVALIAAGQKPEFHYLKALGIIFSYVTCLALIIYRLAYWYYDKQTS